MTFHKCASTLFSEEILKRISTHDHIDYEKAFYLGYESDIDKILVREKGFVYGPIRLSTPRHLKIGKLSEQLVDLSLSKQSKVVIMIRDPRDVLVSSYYSFGFQHGFSPVAEIREHQISQREEIQRMSLDEYVLSQVEQKISDFGRIQDLCGKHPSVHLLKYEDMIENFEKFKLQLQESMGLQESTCAMIFEKSRPTQFENVNSHQRSGKVRAFEEKLKPKTLEVLNNEMVQVLKEFNYL